LAGDMLAVLPSARVAQTLRLIEQEGQASIAFSVIDRLGQRMSKPLLQIRIERGDRIEGPR